MKSFNYKFLYIDSSVAILVLNNELSKKNLNAQLIVSHEILVAEILSFVTRDRFPSEKYEEFLSKVAIQHLVAPIKWCKQVLHYGYCKGADCLHLACAMSMSSPKYSELTFLTCDIRQGEIARKIGFNVPELLVGDKKKL